jgi:hypothetical protein
LIVLEDLNFQWNETDVKRVINMWKQGTSLADICEKVKRPGEEVFLLLLDLSINNKIKKRDGFIWGMTNKSLKSDVNA